jgi:hypothetical protein
MPCFLLLSYQPYLLLHSPASTAFKKKFFWNVPSFSSSRGLMT